MTEQTMIPTRNETASISTAEDKPAKKSKPAKQTIAKNAKKDPKVNSTVTDDQKRLARNAALREWRKKNAAHMKTYMAEWRLKRKGKESEPATPRQERGQQTVGSATGKALSTTMKRSTKTATMRATSRMSKKSKTGRKA